MTITPEQISAAEAVQRAAAHDKSPSVRLVAGPGTGKSSAIVRRVCWLLTQSIPAENIWAVSFTRASAHDLRLRVHAQSQNLGYEAANQVRVTTLHSLALRLLRMAGQLAAYPVEPLVLDQWEVENIFDEEFGYLHNVGKRRREDIRRAHEAFWSTGQWGPPNYIPPDPEISAEERDQFQAFHTPRSQTYACVLPGQIIRQCVELIEAGLLDAVQMLQLRHLIVDEFQDLNPNDLRFVRFMSQQGATVFVAGDDDQSVYSFRFASPAGIQTFPGDYPGTGQHQLTACFRCAPQIQAASMALIAANPGPNRIPKNHHSLYAAADPPITGYTHRWRFGHAKQEAKAIAESCKKLIEAGMNPRDILILLSNQRALAQPLIGALEEAAVEAEHPREESFLDSDTGRLALALVRIVSEPNDYVSHRALLGLRRGVGVGRCSLVYEAVIQNNLNFRSIFYGNLPAGAFTGHALSTINHARTTCAIIADWQGEDTLEQRAAEIGQMVQNHFNAAAAATWQAFIANLPQGMTLKELRDFLWADTDEQQTAVLESVLARLGLPVPEEGPLPPRVRIMTMHGAKGLSGRVVFIPGLEEPIFPGPRRKPYMGLILEAARLLYVSITRARAACVVSFANHRLVNGEMCKHAHSRFASQLAGPLGYREGGLTEGEVGEIMADSANL
ncbi:MAG TPA: ATP-dependent helicase [Gemmataceae bacterium]|jgi:superfamily I DNA/RNA helicase|nr:ATP-dependent helicase [Gemmataceae bacterium]